MLLSALCVERNLTEVYEQLSLVLWKESQSKFEPKKSRQGNSTLYQHRTK